MSQKGDPVDRFRPIKPSPGRNDDRYKASTDDEEKPKTPKPSIPRALNHRPPTLRRNLVKACSTDEECSSNREPTPSPNRVSKMRPPRGSSLGARPESQIRTVQMTQSYPPDSPRGAIRGARGSSRFTRTRANLVSSSDDPKVIKPPVRKSPRVRGTACKVKQEEEKEPPDIDSNKDKNREESKMVREVFSDCESTTTEEEDDDKVIEKSENGKYIKYSTIIGKGAFKVVYKGSDTTTGEPIAWCELQNTKKGEERERFKAEAEILKGLNHPNIVRYYDYWETKRKSVVLVTEMMNSGTLKTFLKNLNQIKPKVLKKYTRQILLGLHYLHTQNPPIVHRDLKCDNIFINGSDASVKIGDLGLATFRVRSCVKSVIGTPEFMAPEMYEENYNEKVDVYSFGMCLIEMATMEYPYLECAGPMQILRKVTRGEPPDCLQKVDDSELKDIIMWCIQANPFERPTVYDVLNHPFFLEDPEKDPGFLLDVQNKDEAAEPTCNVVNLQLKIVDKNKKGANYPDELAIAFPFDLEKDNTAEVTDLMVKLQYITPKAAEIVKRQMNLRLSVIRCLKTDRLRKAPEEKGPVGLMHQLTTKQIPANFILENAPSDSRAPYRKAPEVGYGIQGAPLQTVKEESPRINQLLSPQEPSYIPTYEGGFRQSQPQNQIVQPVQQGQPTNVGQTANPEQPKHEYGDASHKGKQGPVPDGQQAFLTSDGQSQPLEPNYRQTPVESQRVLLPAETVSSAAVILPKMQPMQYSLQPNGNGNMLYDQLPPEVSSATTRVGTAAYSSEQQLTNSVLPPNGVSQPMPAHCMDGRKVFVQPYQLCANTENSAGSVPNFTTSNLPPVPNQAQIGFECINDQTSNEITRQGQVQYPINGQHGIEQQNLMYCLQDQNQSYGYQVSNVQPKQPLQPNGNRPEAIISYCESNYAVAETRDLYPGTTTNCQQRFEDSTLNLGRVSSPLQEAPPCENHYLANVPTLQQDRSYASVLAQPLPVENVTTDPSSQQEYAVSNSQLQKPLVQPASLTEGTHPGGEANSQQKLMSQHGISNPYDSPILSQQTSQMNPLCNIVMQQNTAAQEQTQITNSSINHHQVATSAFVGGQSSTFDQPILNKSDHVQHPSQCPSQPAFQNNESVSQGTFPCNTQRTDGLGTQSSLSVASSQPQFPADQSQFQQGNLPALQDLRTQQQCQQVSGSTMAMHPTTVVPPPGHAYYPPQPSHVSMQQQESFRQPQHYQEQCQQLPEAGYQQQQTHALYQQQQTQTFSQQPQPTHSLPQQQQTQSLPQQQQTQPLPQQQQTRLLSQQQQTQPFPQLQQIQHLPLQQQTQPLPQQQQTQALQQQQQTQHLPQQQQFQPLAQQQQLLTSNQQQLALEQNTTGQQGLLMLQPRHFPQLTTLEKPEIQESLLGTVGHHAAQLQPGTASHPQPNRTIEFQSQPTSQYLQQHQPNYQPQPQALSSIATMVGKQTPPHFQQQQFGTEHSHAYMHPSVEKTSGTDSRVQQQGLPSQVTEHSLQFAPQPSQQASESVERNFPHSVSRQQQQLIEQQQNQAAQQIGLEHAPQNHQPPQSIARQQTELILQQLQLILNQNQNAQMQPVLQGFQTAQLVDLLSQQLTLSTQQMMNPQGQALPHQQEQHVQQQFTQQTVAAPSVESPMQHLSVKPTAEQFAGVKQAQSTAQSDGEKLRHQQQSVQHNVGHQAQKVDLFQARCIEGQDQGQPQAQQTLSCVNTLGHKKDVNQMNTARSEELYQNETFTQGELRNMYQAQVESSDLVRQQEIQGRMSSQRCDKQMLEQQVFNQPILPVPNEQPVQMDYKELVRENYTLPNKPESRATAEQSQTDQFQNQQFDRLQHTQLQVQVGAVSQTQSFSQILSPPLGQAVYQQPHHVLQQQVQQVWPPLSQQPPTATPVQHSQHEQTSGLQQTPNQCPAQQPQQSHPSMTQQSPAQASQHQVQQAQPPLLQQPPTQAQQQQPSAQALPPQLQQVQTSVPQQPLASQPPQAPQQQVQGSALEQQACQPLAKAPAPQPHQASVQFHQVQCATQQQSALAPQPQQEQHLTPLPQSALPPSETQTMLPVQLHAQQQQNLPTQQHQPPPQFGYEASVQPLQQGNQSLPLQQSQQTPPHQSHHIHSASHQVAMQPQQVPGGGHPSQTHHPQPQAQNVVGQSQQVYQQPPTHQQPAPPALLQQPFHQPTSQQQLLQPILQQPPSAQFQQQFTQHSMQQPGLQVNQQESVQIPQAQHLTGPQQQVGEHANALHARPFQQQPAQISYDTVQLHLADQVIPAPSQQSASHAPQQFTPQPVVQQTPLAMQLQTGIAAQEFGNATGGLQQAYFQPQQVVQQPQCQQAFDGHQPQFEDPQTGMFAVPPQGIHLTNQAPAYEIYQVQPQQVFHVSEQPVNQQPAMIQHQTQTTPFQQQTTQLSVQQGSYCDSGVPSHLPIQPKENLCIPTHNPAEQPSHNQKMLPPPQSARAVPPYPLEPPMHPQLPQNSQRATMAHTAPSQFSPPWNSEPSANTFQPPPLHYTQEQAQHMPSQSSIQQTQMQAQSVGYSESHPVVMGDYGKSLAGLQQSCQQLHVDVSSQFAERTTQCRFIPADERSSEVNGSVSQDQTFATQGTVPGNQSFPSQAPVNHTPNLDQWSDVVEGLRSPPIQSTYKQPTAPPTQILQHSETVVPEVQANQDPVQLVPGANPVSEHATIANVSAPSGSVQQQPYQSQPSQPEPSVAVYPPVARDESCNRVQSEAAPGNNIPGITPLAGNPESSSRAHSNHPLQDSLASLITRPSTPDTHNESVDSCGEAGDSNEQGRTRRLAKSRRSGVRSPMLRVLTIEGTVVECQLDVSKKKIVNFKFDRDAEIDVFIIANTLVSKNLMTSQHVNNFVELMNELIAKLTAEPHKIPVLEGLASKRREERSASPSRARSSHSTHSRPPLPRRAESVETPLSGPCSPPLSAFSSLVQSPQSTVSERLAVVDFRNQRDGLGQPRTASPVQLNVPRLVVPSEAAAGGLGVDQAKPKVRKISRFLVKTVPDPLLNEEPLKTTPAPAAEDRLEIGQAPTSLTPNASGTPGASDRNQDSSLSSQMDANLLFKSVKPTTSSRRDDSQIITFGDVPAFALPGCSEPERRLPGLALLGGYETAGIGGLHGDEYSSYVNSRDSGFGELNRLQILEVTTRNLTDVLESETTVSASEGESTPHSTLPTLDTEVSSPDGPVLDPIAEQDWEGQDPDMVFSARVRRMNKPVKSASLSHPLDPRSLSQELEKLKRPTSLPVSPMDEGVYFPGDGLVDLLPRTERQARSSDAEVQTDSERSGGERRRSRFKISTVNEDRDSTPVSGGRKISANSALNVLMLEVYGEVQSTIDESDSVIQDVLKRHMEERAAFFRRQRDELETILKSGRTTSPSSASTLSSAAAPSESPSHSHHLTSQTFVLRETPGANQNNTWHGNQMAGGPSLRRHFERLQGDAGSNSAGTSPTNQKRKVFDEDFLKLVNNLSSPRPATTFCSARPSLNQLRSGATVVRPPSSPIKDISAPFK